MKRTSVLTALSAVAALALTACGGGGDPLANGGSGGETSGSPSSTVRVGSANFPESVLLAEIYAGALEAEGIDVEKTLNIGSREAYMQALTAENPSLDLIPEYTGNLRLFFDPDAAGTTSEEVYAELQEALPETLTVLEPAEAEDKDAVVVTAETAEQLDLESIGDLAPVAGDMTLGGPPEWKTRQTGVPGLKEKYGVVFGDFRELDAGGPLTLNALVNGQIDAGNLFTTSSSIEANDLVVLDDPEALFAAQNVVPLVRAEAVTDELTAALNAVSAELDTEELRDLVKRVEADQEDPEDVAADFLAEHDLG